MDTTNAANITLPPSSNAKKRKETNSTTQALQIEGKETTNKEKFTELCDTICADLQLHAKPNGVYADDPATTKNLAKLQASIQSTTININFEYSRLHQAFDQFIVFATSKYNYLKYLTEKVIIFSIYYYYFCLICFFSRKRK